MRRIALVKRMHEPRVVLVIQKCINNEESGVCWKNEGCNYPPGEVKKEGMNIALQISQLH